jgi:hypothetical protein
MIFVARVDMAGLDLGTAATEMPLPSPGLAEAPTLTTIAFAFLFACAG